MPGTTFFDRLGHELFRKPGLPILSHIEDPEIFTYDLLRLISFDFFCARIPGQDGTIQI
jgi:hypothetical protein